MVIDMAVYDIHRSPQGPGVASRLYRATVGALIEWNDARQTRNTLAKLSDHELADIGLVRGDIDEIAHRGR